jgi:hypothetical protein
MADPQVLYVAGWGRSGSTLLDALLAERTDALSLGELERFWDLSFRKQLCECGQTFQHCVFWSDVMATVREQLPMDDVHAARAEHLRFTRFARLRLRLPARSWEPAWKTVWDAQRLLYERITDASGRHVLIDSSKTPLIPFFAARSAYRCEGFRMVQLVRHPCAVAFSWSNPKLLPSGKPMNERHGPFSSAANWSLRNHVAKQARKMMRDRACLLRYEDFIDDVDGTIDMLANQLECSTRDDSRAEEPSNGVGHAIGGNSSRSSRTSINRDDRWKQSMGLGPRAFVWLSTGWFARKYGYRWNGVAADEHPPG